MLCNKINLNFIKLFSLFIFLLFCEKAESQTYFGIKYIGLSGHLKQPINSQLYKNKIDTKGYFVVNSGGIVSVEKGIYKNWLSVKFVQSFLSDCALQFAGFTHIGLRVSYSKNNYSISIGNGPTLFYRKDWNQLNGYIDEGLFKYKKGFQYIFFWYAGEIVYNYSFANNIDFSITLIPGPPEFFTIAPGIRYKL